MPDHLNYQDNEMSRETGDEIARAFQSHLVALLTLTASLAAGLKLNLSDVAALEHLSVNRAGGLSPGELGRRLRLSTGAVTALVDRLERAGYVTRQPHSHDRRQITLKLTAAGERTGQEKLEPILVGVQQLGHALSEEGRTTVARFFIETAQLMNDYEPKTPT